MIFPDRVRGRKRSCVIQHLTSRGQRTSQSSGILRKNVHGRKPLIGGNERRNASHASLKTQLMLLRRTRTRTQQLADKTITARSLIQTCPRTKKRRVPRVAIRAHQRVGDLSVTPFHRGHLHTNHFNSSVTPKGHEQPQIVLWDSTDDAAFAWNPGDGKTHNTEQRDPGTCFYGDVALFYLSGVIIQCAYAGEIRYDSMNPNVLRCVSYSDKCKRIPCDVPICGYRLLTAHSSVF